jgi:hypothetical protein
MGILRRIALLPLAPVEGVLWLAHVLQEIAEAELDDPALLRARLDEAEEAHARGELSDEELEAIEEAILDRLVGIPVPADGTAHHEVIDG